MKIAMVVAVLAAALRAQQADPWSAMRAANPAGLNFHLRLAGNLTFHDRELIPAVLQMPGPASPPGPAEWQLFGLLLDPAGQCGTVAKPCTIQGNQLLRGDFPSQNGEGHPILLNRYLPALPPGHYRAAALARRMTIERSGTSSYSRYTEPPQYAVSETVELTIVPSSLEWLRDTTAASIAVLRRGQPRTPEEYEELERAAHQLAALDTPASREASLDLAFRAEPSLLAGLRNSRDPAQVCERMQAVVAAPAQSVSTAFLYTMTEICSQVHLPPAPVPPSTKPVAIAVLSAAPPKPFLTAPADPAMTAWFEKRRDYTEGLWNKATAALCASLPKKEAEPKWVALVTLLERVNQLRVNRPPQADPSWIPALSREFVSSYPSVEAPRRQYLLDMFTSTVSTPDVLPLIEGVLDSWKPGDYYEAVHSALRALNRIDPKRAQARILAEITRPETWLDTAQLEMLPPSAVPPMDDALIEALARAQRPPGWNPQLRMAALARYGTPKALPRMKAIYESQQGCQPELLAYFVRVDPAYADRVFRAQPWDMHAPPPVCAVQYFQRIPPIAMSPGMEAYLAAFLMHSDVYVKTTAAKALGRYGSPAALPKLWDTLRYFQDWWKGKPTELAANGQSVALEVELRNAIARGRNWLANQADLRLLDSVCSSDWCRGETRHDLDSWEGPLRIEIREGQHRVAQYSGLETLAALKAKLAQFPAGTRFALDATGKDADEIRRFLASRNLAIR